MFEKDFMLEGKTAGLLYNEFAKNAPIYDYHCHISAKDIYEDIEFEDISSVWLSHDHYKWRAMRYAGIPERYITGEAEGKEKFKMWSKTCERLIGSPLYHWANMELKTYFGVNEILKESNSEKIYGICNEKIRSLQLSPIKMIKNSNVKLICTTDDPADTLEYHMLFKMKHKADIKILPTFRPDKALNILSQDYKKYIEKLSLVSNQNIKTYDDLVEVLMKRIQYFSKVGCVLSDHSLESLSYMPVVKADEVEDIFTRRMLGEPVSAEDADKFRYHSLKLLAQEYKKKGWVMQLHIGAMRNLNKTKFRKLGADAGFDIMNDFQIAESLTELLNTMDELNSLPKTVLYALNSKDNLVLSSIPHCFTEDGIPGKVQFGAAWWFLDNKEGIRSHLKSIASQGMLPYFIGMLTDSRSFLSYVRHDYFRRILCSYIGELVDKGEFENDESMLKEIVEGICFTNIKSYLSLEGNQ